MSPEVNPFRWVLPLKHMASVKTAQLLWRNSVDKQKLKDYYTDAVSEKIPSISQYVPLSNDQLPVPIGMKSEFKYFFRRMIRRAVGWLSHIKNWEEPREKEGEIHQNFMKRFLYFIDNFSWTNEGCADGETMLRSYVSNKETIDYGTFTQLCGYCMEDEIMKFSKTMDWKNCKEVDDNWDEIYWYWKLHRTLPTEEMFPPHRFKDSYPYERFLSFWEEKTSDEDNFNGELFDWTLTNHGNWSQIRYFRNQIEKYEDFETYCVDDDLFDNDYFADSLDDKGVVYMVQEMKNKTLQNCINVCPKFFRPFMSWPWISLIGNWIQVLENAGELHFFELFELRLPFDTFKTVWTVFYQKFRSDDATLTRVLELVKELEDSAYWEIIRDGIEDSRRISLAKTLLNQSKLNIVPELLKYHGDLEMVLGDG